MTREKVLERITENEVVSLLASLVKISSVSGDERKIAEFIQAYCLESSLDSIIDRHGNVISSHTWGYGKKKMLWNSHTDTVGFGDGWTRDPLGAQIENGFMYGRGTADCKSSIAAQIIAAKALVESGADLEGELVLAHVVEEEVSNVDKKGTVLMIRDGFKADMAINGEASDLEVHLVCEGMLELRVRTFGRRAHGALPEEGVNAIVHMSRFINELMKITPGVNKYTGPGAVTPGVISGGERSCVVPDLCELKIARFTVPGENSEMFMKQVKDIFLRLEKEDPSFKAEVELTYDSNPSEISEDSPVVRHLVQGIQDVRGASFKPVFSGTPQHDDADWLSNMAGIPTVIFGPGKTTAGHTPDEYVNLQDVVDAAKIYAMTAFNAFEKNKY